MSILLAWFERWSRWRRDRRALRELRGFDDAMLDDLGISRGEIADYVAGRLSVGDAGPEAGRHLTLVWSASSAEVDEGCDPECCPEAA